MSFRQFGGLNYNPRHNVVSSNFNTSNKLVVKENAGISDNLKVTNDLLVQGNADICGNLTANYMFLSSGTNYSTQANAVVPKSYVDTVATGLNFQPDVTCISTFDNSYNTTSYPVPIYPQYASYASSGFVIDGYTVSVGDSVLLNDQGTPSTSAAINNGVYDLSSNGTNNYFIRSTTELPDGYDAANVFIQTTNGTIDGNGWVQTQKTQNQEAIVGQDPLLFYSFNFSGGSSYKPGIGLYTNQVGNNLYLNVDSSLNFLTNIDASGGGTLDVGTQSSILNLGSIDTSVNIAGNSYVYTPFSLGSTFSPQTLNITSTSTSTQITFNWTIPSLYKNISSSFKNISATLYANISGTIQTYPILTDISSNINSLNTIIVTNQTSSNGFLNNSTTTYTYYSSDFSNMSQDASNNQLILWYSNFSPYPNVSYAGYTSFQSIGTPSIVKFNYGGTTTIETPASLDSNFNVINGSLGLQCYVEYIYSTITTGPPFISNYQIPSNGYSSNGSSTRYNSQISDSGTSSTITIQNLSSNANMNTVFTVSNMYPDSTYNFSVQAKNSSNPNYGPTGPYSYLTPAPSYPSSTFFVANPLFNSLGKKYSNSNATYYKKVTDNSTINNTDIINYNNISSSGFISDNIITAVQPNGTYGISSSSSYLTATALLNSTSTSKTVTSFPGGQIFTNNSGGITVTSTTFDAYYKGNPYNQGFYLDCSTNMTISGSYFNPPTSTLFNATLTVAGSLSPPPSSNYSFYIDDLSSNPSYNITSPASFTLNSNNNYYSNLVSGIWVLNQSKNPVFSVNQLKLNNMGDYFYASPLVTYNIIGGVTGIQQETDTQHVTNITSGSGGLLFQNPIDISNNNISGTTQINAVSSNYNTDISLNITFNNLLAQVTQNNIANINVICDQPSYKLITNVLATTIQTVGSLTSGYKGYRIWSANVDSGIPTGGTMSPAGLAPYPYIVYNTASIPNNTATGSSPTTSNQGYVNISYNNIWDISNNTVTNQELLIANGNFTTNNSYYLNYGSISSANGNTINYNRLANTGNNGLKFATFAWNIDTGTTSTIATTYINFVLLFTSQIYQNINTNTYYYDSGFTQPLYLFYRFEYTGEVATWGTDYTNANYFPNTAWVSINTSTIASNATINTNIICNLNNATNVYYYPPISVTSSGTYYTFKAPKPTVDILDYNATLYLRIGMPNNVTNNSFSSINCYFSGS